MGEKRTREKVQIAFPANIGASMAKPKIQRPHTPVVGVCWYTPQDWERIKETATDPDLFEATFTEWETMAKENLASIFMAYPNARKVLINADEFFSWCFLRGRPNDARARSEFVADKVSAIDDANLATGAIERVPRRAN
jgi:hypothetical protein